MILKTITKLFFLLIISTILASCVNNKDQEDVNPIVDPVELTQDVLAGKWELYYFNKLIIPTATNIQSKYRNTEFDGFTVTFAKDGTYYENNVFGHKNVEGKYLIGNYTDDDVEKIWVSGALPGKTKNAVFMTYETLKTKIDTFTKAEIPAMFEDHFAFRDRYGGDAQGKGYRIEDIRYYRNMEKAPNYMPADKEFQKNVLNVSDILGRWEFYDYYIRIDQVLYPAPPEIVAEYGLQFVFKIVNGKQEFYEYVPGKEKENRKGEFKIIDDVVNIFTKYDDDGEEVIESFKLWVKDPLGTTGGQKMIKSYDKYRDINDVLKEKEEFDFFKRVGDN